MGKKEFNSDSFKNYLKENKLTYHSKKESEFLKKDVLKEDKDIDYEVEDDEDIVDSPVEDTDKKSGRFLGSRSGPSEKFKDLAYKTLALRDKENLEEGRTYQLPKGARDKKRSVSRRREEVSDFLLEDRKLRRKGRTSKRNYLREEISKNIEDYNPSREDLLKSRRRRLALLAKRKKKD